MLAQNKRDIAAELNDLFASFDMLNLRSFGYGHSFGVLSHYYGREEGLELREDIDTVLEPGMVKSMFETDCERSPLISGGFHGADDHGGRRLARSWWVPKSPRP